MRKKRKLSQVKNKQNKIQNPKLKKPNQPKQFLSRRNSFTAPLSKMIPEFSIMSHSGQQADGAVLCFETRAVERKFLRLDCYQTGRRMQIP